MKKFRIRPLPTPRGFLRAEFTDSYGKPCTVQESSVIPHLWLGRTENEPPHHVSGSDLPPWMHLNRAQVRELVRVMQTWLDKGRLPRGRRAAAALSVKP
jgi:hypothetical protein